MQTSRNPKMEMYTLLDILCEGGELSEEQRTRLNELLRSDENLRFEYLAYLAIDSSLARETTEPVHPTKTEWREILLHGDKAGDSCPLCPPLDEEPSSTGLLDRWKGFGTPPVLFSLTILLSTLLFVAALLLQQRHLSNLPPAPAVPFVRVAEVPSTHNSTPNTTNKTKKVSDIKPTLARLDKTDHCQWTKNRKNSFLGENLSTGQILDLEQGQAEVQFCSGARVFLEGPAVFEVVSTNSGRLIAGSMTADVPDEAHGFTVFAPTMDIVDLGTQFAVSADPSNNTAVRVLAGKVQAHWSQSEGHQVQAAELVTGETLEVDRTGMCNTTPVSPHLPSCLPKLQQPTLPPPIDPDLVWQASPDNRPIIKRGPAGSWDALRADNPFVIVEHDKLYCFYKGLDKPISLGGMQRIGLVTSVDGIHWEKPLTQPVLEEGPEGAFDSCGVKLPMVYKHDGVYYMFYSGLGNGTKQIGLATSTDLIHWNKQSENPVLARRGGSWDTALSTHPTSIFERNNQFYMLFRGMKSFFNEQGLGLAVSSDLRHWRRVQSEPVIPVSEEIYSFGGAITQDGYVAIAHASGEPYWFSNDLVHWEKGPSAKFDLPWADTVSNLFYWRGEWNILYERKDYVYRAVLK